MANSGLRVAGTAPIGASTATIICGLALTSVTLPADHVVDVFTVAAVGVGLSLSLATGIEAGVSVRNLFRVDILMLGVLYALTFLEFLFPQPDLDGLVSVAAATRGTNAVLLGFGGIVVGRHLVPRQYRFGRISTLVDVRPSSIFWLFVIATLLGYAHIFLAVNFDPFEALRQMSLPRFWQPWGRGKYGDAYSLLYELGLLIYLLPPIAGLIYARSKDYNVLKKLAVTTVLIFTFYYGFSSGTRSMFATYVITFTGAYLLNMPKITLWRALYHGAPILILLLLGTAYMLEFRETGLSNFSFSESEIDSLYVDYNVVIVSRLTDVFPDSYAFLGFEIPYSALIRPIPRVLWPGKPEGLSVTIESAAGAPGGVTTSCTFIGEAYMAGGLLAVLFTGLLFGAAAEMWNRVGREINSHFAQLLYVSGFFCAVVAMRSMLSMVPPMLPTLALWLYGKLWPPRSSRRRSAATISRIGS